METPPAGGGGGSDGTDALVALLDKERQKNIEQAMKLVPASGSKSRAGKLPTQ